MTNQEIECTCEVDCQVEPCCGLTSHKIIHGPCHSPGPEVWEALERMTPAAEQYIRHAREVIGNPSVAIADALDDIDRWTIEARDLLSIRKEKV